jgi:hypothetical protein
LVFDFCAIFFFPQGSLFESCKSNEGKDYENGSMLYDYGGFFFSFHFSIKIKIRWWIM